MGPAESELDRILTDYSLLQSAYHLRSRVRLSLLKNGFGTIDPILSDVESARDNGPPYALLAFDAAKMYAFAAQQQPLFQQKAIEHLKAAVQQGWPVSVLQADSLLDPLVKEAGLTDTGTGSAYDHQSVGCRSGAVRPQSGFGTHHNHPCAAAPLPLMLHQRMTEDAAALARIMPLRNY